MDRAAFALSPSGKLASTERGQWAFVPNPLPPAGLDLRPVLLKCMEVSQAVGELNGVARLLRDPMLLIRPLQAREALSSSSMEGTYSTVDDLMIAELETVERQPSSDTREVWNYRRALTSALTSMETVPLSQRTLRDAHRMLLSGVQRNRGANVEAGEFKRHQNFIGAYEIEKARFVPPPPRETIDCLNDLEKFIHREDRNDIPPLVEAALIHYQFETIHPFADGNGRVGRMLVTLHLHMMKTIRQPILYLSPIFETRKDEYIDRLFEVSLRGDWLAWINFFLDVVALSCRATIATADRLRELEMDFRRRLENSGRSPNLTRIADDLFRQPVVTIPIVAQRLGVTYRAAQLNIDSLVRANILSEIPGTSHPKFFRAQEVLDAIKETPGSNA